jgi:hypothetical protein
MEKQETNKLRQDLSPQEREKAELIGRLPVGQKLKTAWTMRVEKFIPSRENTKAVILAKVAACDFGGRHAQAGEASAAHTGPALPATRGTISCHRLFNPLAHRSNFGFLARC